MQLSKKSQKTLYLYKNFKKISTGSSTVYKYRTQDIYYTLIIVVLSLIGKNKPGAD